MPRKLDGPTVKLAVRLIRERGTEVFHRPVTDGKPHCGTFIRDVEELLINIEDLPPEGMPKCGRCDALAHEDFLNRLATIYELALRAAL